MRPGSVVLGLNDSVEVTWRRGKFIGAHSFIDHWIKAITCCGLLDFRSSLPARLRSFDSRFIRHWSSGITTKKWNSYSTPTPTPATTTTITTTIHTHMTSFLGHLGKKGGSQMIQLTFWSHANVKTLSQSTRLTLSPHIHVDIAIAPVLAVVHRFSCDTSSKETCQDRGKQWTADGYISIGPSCSVPLHPSQVRAL